MVWMETKNHGKIQAHGPAPPSPRYGGEVHWAQQGVEGDGSGGPKVLGVAEAVNQPRFTNCLLRLFMILVIIIYC